MAFISPRFDECVECRFHNPNSIVSRCLACSAGEYFEERFEEMDPDHDDWKHFKKNADYDD